MIQFVKADYQEQAFPLNLAASSAIVAVGGISLGLISDLALKALGFGATALKISKAISTSITAIGAVGVVAGLGMSAFLLAVLMYRMTTEPNQS